MKQGSVTIFLTLVMAAVLSLFMTLLEGAKNNIYKLKAECSVDMGIDSIFAEYHRELLEQYDLFFIDTSYGGMVPSVLNTTNHMKNYMEYNLNPTKELFLTNISSFYTLQPEAIEVLSMAVATDHYGQVYENQAITYMKSKYGINDIEKFLQNTNLISQNCLLDNDVQQNRINIENQIQNTPKPKEEVSPDVWEEVKVNNPADQVNSTRNIGVLQLVIEDNNTLSGRGILPDNYISRRRPITGDGLPENTDRPNESTDQILFVEYLLEKFGYYTKEKETGELQYQLEYILCGNSTDVENLKETVNKLLLIREAANVAYLFSDSAKMAQADALASSLSIITQVPPLQPLIKYSLVFAWAYAESVSDVKELLEQGKVSLLKQKGEWKLSLTQMLSYEDHLQVNSTSEKGLTYGEYIKLLLFFEKREDRTMRSMDIIEMDIRKTQGNSNFRIDGCIDSLSLYVTVTENKKRRYEIMRFYKM